MESETKLATAAIEDTEEEKPEIVPVEIKLEVPRQEVIVEDTMRLEVKKEEEAEAEYDTKLAKALVPEIKLEEVAVEIKKEGTDKEVEMELAKALVPEVKREEVAAEEIQKEDEAELEDAANKLAEALEPEIKLEFEEEEEDQSDM
jgi:hypothetical protein